MGLAVPTSRRQESARAWRMASIVPNSTQKISEQKTLDNNDSYPNLKYRRRKDGRTVQKPHFTFENHWVVPHNLYLCVKYGAHINVEVTSSIKAMNYLYTYVYKGHDRVTMAVTTVEQPAPQAKAEAAEGQVEDEIMTFVDARYCSAPEACCQWRLSGRP